MPPPSPRLCILLATLSLSACGSLMPDMSHPPLTRTEKTQEMAVIKQARGYWTLSQIKGMDSLPPEATLTLHPFNIADRSQLRVHGSSGVNYYSGAGKINWLRGRLQIHGLQSTRQASPASIKPLERQLLAQLERVVSFEVKGQQLVLTTLAGNTLSFKRQE